MKPVVYIVGGAIAAYADLFRSLGIEVTNNHHNATMACFTGGSDVSPELYNAQAHRETYSDARRDAYEQVFYNDFVKRGIPMVGICRGGQFLNVMNGGAMYQHVSKHTRDHVLQDVLSGSTLWVSSTHHQMMKPTSEAILVAVAYEYGKREWYEEYAPFEDTSPEDIEVVFYEKTKCLCFQPHPEFVGDRYVHMRTYFNELLERFAITNSVEV